MDRGIIVSGEGEVRATPDVLAVTLEVETRAGTVAEARAMNTEAAAKLIAVLKAGGIAERDIQTRNISVNAEYDRPDRGAPSVAGYVVSNSIRVSLRDLEKAGGAIDDALAAAGDAGRLGGSRFDFSKPAPLYVEAIRRYGSRWITGYGSAISLSLAFKQRYGHPPGACRREMGRTSPKAPSGDGDSTSDPEDLQ